MSGVRSAGDPARQRSLRSLGGEEFFALPPSTSLPRALKVAERVHQAVRRLRLRNETGVEFGVTISISVARMEPGEDAKRLIARADNALCAAMHGGRDRVLSYQPGQSMLGSL